jgi:hypothetical protein
MMHIPNPLLTLDLHQAASILSDQPLHLAPQDKT